MQRCYEITVVVSPVAGDDVCKEVMQKIRDVVQGHKGEVLNVDDWGIRRLAYPIQKFDDGHYFLLKLKTIPDSVMEVERLLRLREDVIRYMTIRAEESGDIEIKKGTSDDDVNASADKGGADEHGS